MAAGAVSGATAVGCAGPDGSSAPPREGPGVSPLGPPAGNMIDFPTPERIRTAWRE